MNSPAWFSLLTVVCLPWSVNAASLYIGDVAADGMTVPAGTVGPDTAGDPQGNITYAFFSPADIYINTSGIAQVIELTEVNFYVFDGRGGQQLTPFVATLSGSGAAGIDYNVLAEGDPITAADGLNLGNFSIAGAGGFVTLDAGATLVAGFHQTAAMVPWEEPAGASDFDYISEDDQIPAEGGPLNADANWSNLGREYRYNIGFEASAIPEPSALLFLFPAISLLLIFRRRR